jgi:hypothetical protein
MSYGIAFGSGSGMAKLYRAAQALKRPSKFCKPGEPIPVTLWLTLGDPPLHEGPGHEKLNQPTLLVLAQDASIGQCWFSGPIELDDKADQPAFWILEKTADAKAGDNWFLRLKRITDGASWLDEWIPTEEVAWYASTEAHQFQPGPKSPQATSGKERSYNDTYDELQLTKQDYDNKEFRIWPHLITIKPAL